MAPPEIISPRRSYGIIFCELHFVQRLSEFTYLSYSCAYRPVAAGFVNELCRVHWLFVNEPRNGSAFRVNTFAGSPHYLCVTTSQVAFARTLARSYVLRIIILFYSYGTKSAIVCGSNRCSCWTNSRRRYGTVFVPVPSMRGPTGNRDDLGDAESQRHAAICEFWIILVTRFSGIRI